MVSNSHSSSCRPLIAICLILNLTLAVSNSFATGGTCPGGPSDPCYTQGSNAAQQYALTSTNLFAPTYNCSTGLQQAIAADSLMYRSILFVYNRYRVSQLCASNFCQASAPANSTVIVSPSSPYASFISNCSASSCASQGDENTDLGTLYYEINSTVLPNILGNHSSNCGGPTSGVIPPYGYPLN